MRSCPQCGATVQDGDDFCGNCGTYLGWSAGEVPPPGPGDAVEPGPATAVVEDRSGPIVEPGSAPEAGTGATGERVAEPATDTGAGTGSAPGVEAGPRPVVPVEAGAPPGWWTRWRVRARARSRLGADTGPATGTGIATSAAGPTAARASTGAGTGAVMGAGPSEVVLGPVLPRRPEARRPLPTAGAGIVLEGPPCPACGTTNPPSRRFCRRCATPLFPAESVVGATRRRRSRRRGDTSKWLRRLAALLVVVALVVAGVLVHPKAVELFEDLRDRLAEPAPIAPVSTSATAQVPDHPATAAADGLSNRYWGAPAVGDAVEFSFEKPFRLLAVVVHAGASARPEQFGEQARPAALDVVVTSAGGTSRTIAVVLADQPGPQRTDTGIGDVVAVRLVVKSAAGLDAGRHIALGEVEFFRRP